MWCRNVMFKRGNISINVSNIEMEYLRQRRPQENLRNLNQSSCSFPSTLIIFFKNMNTFILDRPAQSHISLSLYTLCTGTSFTPYTLYTWTIYYLKSRFFASKEPWNVSYLAILCHNLYLLIIWFISRRFQYYYHISNTGVAF